MKKQFYLIAALFLMLTVSFSSCKDDEPEPEPELTETERLLTTKKWSLHTSTLYGSYDIDTDTLISGTDTSMVTTQNRYLKFEMNGDAGYYDAQADTVTVDYEYSLNDLQTEMRLWEPASVIYWQFYTDFDYKIETLNENTFVIKGDSKRRMIDASYDRYSIVKHEMTAL